ncbi:MAG: GNAT family N-acetyltransferase [candidate division WOR-3 bacterium]|nr:MAG: GNAT family N-acetyltransferase [candidate division WOR-3 bacterium]
MVEIIAVESQEQLDDIRKLFTEYVDSLGFDLHFQEYEREYAQLPGEYAPPDGRLFLALCDGEVCGCIALRKIDEHTCEMKRLYVRPHYRGKKIGRLLSEKLITEARTVGYRSMRLDTIPQMTAAIALYRSLGFRDIEPYRYNPIPGALFMELPL